MYIYINNMNRQNNQLHYNIDVDVLFVVEETIFRVHKNIIGLSSKMFYVMFICATVRYSKNGDEDDNIQEIVLEGELSKTFENILSYIYPNTFIMIDWDNVSEFLRFSEKYIMDSVLLSAKTFLER